MRTLALNVKSTKKAFDFPVTEQVYQNLYDIMNGVVVNEDDVQRLIGLLVMLTEVDGVAAVVVDHAQAGDAEWEFSIYTGSDLSDERELVEIKAVDFGEEVQGESLIGDIVDGFANCNIFPKERRRRFRFVNKLNDREKVWAELLDAYLSCAAPEPGEEGQGDDPKLLMEYPTSADIADDLEDMGIMELDFITRYMYANGYHPARRPDGMLGWKIFKPVL